MKDLKMIKVLNYSFYRGFYKAFKKSCYQNQYYFWLLFGCMHCFKCVSCNTEKSINYQLKTQYLEKSPWTLHKHELQNLLQRFYVVHVHNVAHNSEVEGDLDLNILQKNKISSVANMSRIQHSLVMLAWTKVPCIQSRSAVIQLVKVHLCVN